MTLEAGPGIGHAVLEPADGAAGARAAQAGGAFGNNAPLWGSMSREFRAQLPGGDPDANDDWPEVHTSVRCAATATGGSRRSRCGPERGRARRLHRAGEGRVQPARRDVSRRHLRRAVPGDEHHARCRAPSSRMSGKVTRLGCEGRTSTTSSTRRRARRSVYTQSEPLSLAAYPVDDEVSGDDLPLAVPRRRSQAGTAADRHRHQRRATARRACTRRRW